YYFFSICDNQRHLHSFPTRRSSDLEIVKRTITFSESPSNAVVIMDDDLTDLTGINPALVSMRQATENDLLVLPAMSFIGTLAIRSEEHTSELQSRENLVCRLLLEKK